MQFKFELREWAEFTSLTPTVLTVYLDTQQGPDIKFLARKGREIRELYREDRDIRENFLKALRETREFLKNKKNIPAHGLAIIADPSQDVFKTYKLPRPVGNLVVLDTSPYIRPLAQLKEDWEPFGLVLMDNSHAQLYLVNQSQITDSKTLKTDILGKQKKGGWSQARYSRRRTNQIEEFLRQVARELAPLLREEHVKRIILAGSADNKRKLVDFLPLNLQKKVVGFLDLSMDTDENTLLRKVFPLFFDAEKIEEDKMILEVRDRIACNGLGVAGMEGVAQAVIEGRAERVLVKADLKPEGWKCERCDIMEEGVETECVLCGKRVYPVDMVEEIVEYAHKTSAEVIFVRASNQVLEAMGNICAFLRY